MATRVGKWASEDGTEFDAKADAEMHDALVKFEEEFDVETENIKDFLNLRAIKAKYFPPKPRAKK